MHKRSATPHVATKKAEDGPIQFTVRRREGFSRQLQRFGITGSDHQNQRQHHQHVPRTNVNSQQQTKTDLTINTVTQTSSTM